MAEPPTNGCYVTIDGAQFPIARSLASALKSLIQDQPTRTGKVIMHIKSGGVSTVELNTIFID